MDPVQSLAPVPLTMIALTLAVSLLITMLVMVGLVHLATSSGTTPGPQIHNTVFAASP